MFRLTIVLRAASATALITTFALGGGATATADPNTGSTSDLNKLGGSMSKGYTLNNCQPQEVSGGILAEAICGQNPDSNGPSGAMYFLLGSASDLDFSFKHVLGKFTPAACSSDTGQSPTTWSQSGQTGGKLACGTDNNQPAVLWTNDSKSVLGEIRGSQGSDLGALYKWWQANG